jgi:hypothetical protein
MNELAKLPPGLAQMGERARVLVFEHYNFERVVDGVMNALKYVAPARA